MGKQLVNFIKSITLFELLFSDQRDVEIFYTINGKKPDPFPKVGSERYTMQYFAPFTLPAGKQTVKAMAVSKYVIILHFQCNNSCYVIDLTFWGLFIV
jgi:hypothetical protein